MTNKMAKLRKKNPRGSWIPVFETRDAIVAVISAVLTGSTIYFVTRRRKADQISAI